MVTQVAEHLVHRLDVLIERFAAAVGDEHHGVSTDQHRSTGGGIITLAGHGVEFEMDTMTVDVAGIHRQQIETQRALAVGVDHHQITRRVAGHAIMDHRQVGGLACHAGTVVHDLQHNLISRGVDTHVVLSLSAGQMTARAPGGAEAGRLNNDSKSNATTPQEIPASAILKVGQM